MRFHLRRLMLYENDSVLSPVSIKHRGYIIIIPKKRYSEKEYRMILEHECNHIKRRDVIWRKMAVIAECINWYNPLVKWVSRQLIYYQEVLSLIHIFVKVTSRLGEAGINIGTMQVYRDARGGQAVMVIEVDQEVPYEQIAELEKEDGIEKVIYLCLEER